MTQDKNLIIVKKFAVFNINVLSRFAESLEMSGLMMLPRGFSLQKRELKFAIPLYDIAGDNFEEQISTLYEFDKLVELVANINLGENDECYEYDDLNSCVSIYDGYYDGNIVSEEELLSFLNGETKLKSFIRITN
jgi:hypothetical protein